jgi:CRP-like cAMP-binding protein
LDEAGNEIVRHEPGSFLGELNLLSGQTVFVSAVVTEPLRYVAVDRDALRKLLFEDGPLKGQSSSAAASVGLRRSPRCRRPEA